VEVHVVGQRAGGHGPPSLVGTGRHLSHVPHPGNSDPRLSIGKRWVSGVGALRKRAPVSSEEAIRKRLHAP
jgi:hypothetical protein